MQRTLRKGRQAQMRRQVPLKRAPSSTTRVGEHTLPVTFAVRPSTNSLLAMMSPSTVPFILAVATLMRASVTRAPLLMMSVPSAEVTWPAKLPTMRSIDLKQTSPLNVRTSPTKPSQLSLLTFIRGAGSSRLATACALTVYLSFCTFLDGCFHRSALQRHYKFVCYGSGRKRECDYNTGFFSIILQFYCSS